MENSFRIPFRETVMLLDRAAGSEFRAEARDVSSGGMFIGTRADLEPGDAVALRFAWPEGGWFEAEATVVREVEAASGDGESGYGLKFERVQLAELARLESWVRRRAAADAPAGQREPLRKLMAVAERINAGLELREILDHVYTSFRDIIPYDRIGLSLLKNGGRTVTAVWARSETPVTVLAEGYSAPVRGSSLEVVVRVNEPRIINDLEEYLRLHPGSDSTRRIVAEGMRSSLTCPLIAEGRPKGFLFFSSRRPNNYSMAHVEIFLDLAHQVSLAVERGLLFDHVLRIKRRLENANKKLRRLSQFDRLTMSRNRRYLDHRLSVEWRRAKRSRGSLSLIMIDVDHFKAFNDKHGHPAGDRCLAAIARALRGALRRPDEFVARYGGEEFAVLLPDTDAGVAIRTAGILRRSVMDLAILHGASAVHPHVTISLGVAALSGESTGGPEELVARADRELYRAKESGRNRAAVSL